MNISSVKLVCGIGVNDADYTVQIKEVVHGSRYANGQYKQKQVWTCPFYNTWTNMLKRCCSELQLGKYTNYMGCTVSEEWKLFSNFRKWMVEQDWEGMQIDKDILIFGNKLYSAETCVFVSQGVNKFLTDSYKARGEWPLGVSLDKRSGRFRARCNDPFTGKTDVLGYFDCPHEAHQAWLAKKLEHAYALAAIQADPRVAKALIERYERYHLLNEDYYEQYK